MRRNRNSRDNWQFPSWKHVFLFHLLFNFHFDSLAVVPQFRKKQLKFSSTLLENYVHKTVPTGTLSSHSAAPYGPCKTFHCLLPSPPPLPALVLLAQSLYSNTNPAGRRIWQEEEEVEIPVRFVSSDILFQMVVVVFFSSFINLNFLSFIAFRLSAWERPFRHRAHPLMKVIIFCTALEELTAIEVTPSASQEGFWCSAVLSVVVYCYPCVITERFL